MNRSIVFLVSLFLVVGMSFVGAAAEVNIKINVPPSPAPGISSPP
jgi:Na+-transporting methylmalonyl-CoA/oxaloacetate decarboxylase gamma subunit